MADILGEAGEKKLLLGNEAIARGLLEAGIGFASAYPGTPSSEIIDTLLEVKRISNLEFYVEISINEKVAYEAAFSASLTGIRAFTAAKHVGINVAADAVATSAYIGTNSGFAFVSADDPNCWSSQNEQDNRWYARLFGLVVLEPSVPQEAKDFAKAVNACVIWHASVLRELRKHLERKYNSEFHKVIIAGFMAFIKNSISIT